MAMYSSLSPVVSNIFMKLYEEMAMNSAVCKPSLWLRRVDDTFVIWKHSIEDLHNFLHHLNNLRPSIKFIMEMEVNGYLPFLDVLVMKKGAL
jgi:hypothetical protein